MLWFLNLIMTLKDITSRHKNEIIIVFGESTTQIP